MEMLLVNMCGIAVIAFMIYIMIDTFKHNTNQSQPKRFGLFITHYVSILLFIFFVGWGFLIPYILGVSVILLVGMFVIARVILRNICK